ncbi:putative oxidoreductase [Trichoplax sp. H2]|nr:putative oxidoreductase [Trichoplax sp. H2]|eukprot:RDD36247.1 putative oxidoreductase [Trichoplax sp. H2]
MPFQFESVLVTGSSRGIGFEMVRQLANLSCPPKYIFASCRSPDGEAAKELRDFASEHSNVIIIQLDALSNDSIQKSAVLVKEKLDNDGLDLIVNNAGIMTRSPSFLDVTEEDMMRVYKTNVVGPFQVIQAYHSLLAKAGQKKDFAAILNISSTLGSCEKSNFGGLYPYAISKAGMNRMTKGLSCELIRDNIMIMCICPGWVRTALGGLDKARLSPQESVENIVKIIESMDKDKNGIYCNNTGQIIPW